MSFHLVCDECGYSCEDKYGHEGMISHDNWTSDWNLEAGILRGMKDFYKLPTIQEHTTRFVEYVKKHKRIWLEESHPEKLAMWDKHFKEA